MSNGDYIKLHRSVLKWEWYQDENTSRLFIHMLLMANWKDGRFEGIEVPRGSFISTLERLSKETGLSKDMIRTSIKKLKLTTEITTKKHGKITVFSIKNYDKYQDVPTMFPTEIPRSSHDHPTEITRIEERKEGEERKNNNIYTHAYEEFWKAYPRKKDKGNAFKKFNARLVEGFSEVELIEAAKKYASECKCNEIAEKYIKYPSSFLSNTHPFLEYLEKEKPKTEGMPPEEDDEELVGDDW